MILVLILWFIFSCTIYTLAALNIITWFSFIFYGGCFIVTWGIARFVKLKYFTTSDIKNRAVFPEA